MPSISRVGGYITEDPLSHLIAETRQELRISLFRCKPSNEQLGSVHNWGYFEGAVVAIHFAEFGRQHVLGTGVLVAPGVVMTARHVIEPQQQKLRDGLQEILCSGIAGSNLVLWRCQAITLVDTTDVAFLLVEAASALPKLLHQVTLTTRMPRVGEKVVVVGFKHHSKVPVAINSELQLSLMSASGEVTMRYEERRDRVLLPHPCFEVNCAAAGGMTGGPAFDSDGFFLGLITSSFEGDISGPTFLSLPWPALVEQISPVWPKGFYKKPISLLKMDRRICGIHKPEALKVKRDKTSGTLAVTYQHWDI